MKILQASEGVYSFRCPGCGRWHMIPTKQVSWCKPTWHFNGDMENPTFTPDMNIYNNLGHVHAKCHFNIVGGQIQFYDDCTHAQRGNVLELPNVKPLMINR